MATTPTRTMATPIPTTATPMDIIPIRTVIMVIGRGATGAMVDGVIMVIGVRVTGVTVDEVIMAIEARVTEVTRVMVGIAGNIFFG